MSATYDATVSVPVTVEIHDPSVIDRCVKNHDDEGRPHPIGDGEGWRDHYYELRTAEQVIEHIAFNAINNGIDDISRLDGWADLDSSAATITVFARQGDIEVYAR